MSEQTRYFVLTRDVEVPDEKKHLGRNWKTGETRHVFKEGARFDLNEDCCLVYETFGELLDGEQIAIIKPHLKPAPSKIGQWIDRAGGDETGILAALGELGVVKEADVEAAVELLGRKGSTREQVMHRNWMSDHPE